MNLTAEILSLPHLVLSEILHKWVASAVKVELCSDQINGLIELIESPINVEQPTIAVTIEKEWDIEKVHNTLRIKFRSYEDSSELATSTIKIQQTENSSAFNRSIVEISHPSDIIIREYSAEGGEPQVSQYTFPVFDSFDCKYCLRYADPSDTFFPTWKDKEMKLSKFLRAQKVPLPARDRVWVLIKTRSPTNSLISNRSSSELETTPDEVVAVLLEDGVVQISKPFTNLTSTVDKKAVAQLSIDLRQFDASGGRGNKFEVKFN